MELSTSILTLSLMLERKIGEGGWNISRKDENKKMTQLMK